MKSSILTFLVCISFQVFLLPTIIAQSFKGQWTGESDGEVGTMTFDKKGYISFIIDGEKIGGKEYVAEGVKLSMRYEFNEAVMPRTLDFIIYMEGEELIRMLGIYEFLDNNTLLVNMDFDGSDRPQEFSDDDKNQVKLRRIKN